GHVPDVGGRGPILSGASCVHHRVTSRPVRALFDAVPGGCAWATRPRRTFGRRSFRVCRVAVCMVGPGGGTGPGPRVAGTRGDNRPWPPYCGRPTRRGACSARAVVTLTQLLASVVHFGRRNQRR